MHILLFLSSKFSSKEAYLFECFRTRNGSNYELKYMLLISRLSLVIISCDKSSLSTANINESCTLNFSSWTRRNFIGMVNQHEKQLAQLERSTCKLNMCFNLISLHSYLFEILLEKSWEKHSSNPELLGRLIYQLTLSGHPQLVEMSV